MRKIVVAGQTYQYQVGLTCVNLVRPDGSRVQPTFSEISGLSVAEVERGQYKRWFSVTPALLREYIEKNLLQ